MLSYSPHNSADLVLSEATIDHQRYRLKPEFGHRPLTCHVDMRWLSTVELKKMKLYGPSRSTVGIRLHIRYA